MSPRSMARMCATADASVRSSGVARGRLSAAGHACGGGCPACRAVTPVDTKGLTLPLPTQRPAPLTPTRVAFDAEVSDSDPFFWRFSRGLLETGRHYTLTTSAGTITLVVQQGYLSDDELQRVERELRSARVEVPKLLDAPPDALPHITVYVYGETGPGTEHGVPLSTTRAPGPFAGEPALFLRFVKEGRAPTFHEMAHFYEPQTNMSESLSEGLADYVQGRLRPGAAVAFEPQGLDVNAEALRAIADYPELLLAIGDDCLVRFAGPRAPDDGAPTAIQDNEGAVRAWRRSYAEDARHGFYYASRSFVTYLVDRFGLAKVRAVHAVGGRADVYERELGIPVATLRGEWLASLRSKNDGAARRLR